MTTNFELFFKRLKEASKTTTDIELANYLGIKKTTLSMWKKREKVDYELIITKFEHVSFDWLFNRKSTNTEFETTSISEKINSIQLELISINDELHNNKELYITELNTVKENCKKDCEELIELFNKLQQN